MKSSIDIVLVGDAGTGKTSIILSLVGEEFIADVPARVDNITIPADISQDGMETHIIDTSLQEQDEIEIADQVRLADVVCVVCDCSNMQSFYSLEEFWLGLIRGSSFDGPRKPVIVVCNKSDLVEEQQIGHAVEMMDKHSQIATCVMSSALTLDNISETFYYAQTSFLFPVPILYDAERGDLTEPCRDAFTRIFQICDQNNDGKLDDDEMAAFQKYCFGFSLEPTALMDVKSMLYNSVDNAVREGGITREGFIHLQIVFVQRNQQESTWRILGAFGYDKDLTLVDEVNIERMDIVGGVELTEHGFDFVSFIFDKYDSDNDGFLSFSDLTRLSQLDSSFFFNDKSYFDITGRINRKLFMLMWRFVTHVDPVAVLRALIYFGYSFIYGPIESAIQTFPRCGFPDDTRSVFYIKILSASPQSKSDVFSQFQFPSLCLSNFGFEEISVNGTLRLLIFEYCDRLSDDLITFCDGIAFLYDGTDSSSFEYCARAYGQLSSLVSFMAIVRTNCDRRPVRQNFVNQPRAFCSLNRVHLVDFPASSFKQFLQNLFQALCKFVILNFYTELTLMKPVEACCSGFLPQSLFRCPLEY